MRPERTESAAYQKYARSTRAAGKKKKKKEVNSSSSSSKGAADSGGNNVFLCGPRPRGAWRVACLYVLICSDALAPPRHIAVGVLQARRQPPVSCQPRHLEKINKKKKKRKVRCVLIFNEQQNASCFTKALPRCVCVCVCKRSTINDMYLVGHVESPNPHKITGMLSFYLPSFGF